MNKMDQVGGTCNNPLVQPPDYFRADQGLKHIVKGFVDQKLLTH